MTNKFKNLLKIRKLVYNMVSYLEEGIKNECGKYQNR